MTDGEFDDALNDALAVVNDTAASHPRPGTTPAGTGAPTGTGVPGDRPHEVTDGPPYAHGSYADTSYADRPYGDVPYDQFAVAGNGTPAPGSDDHPAPADDTGRPGNTRNTNTRDGGGEAPPARPADRTAAHTPIRHSTPSTSWQDARRIAAGAASGPPAPVTAPLADAFGRTLAAPLTALTDLPSFDTSAMDGWAVSGPGPWRVDHTDESGPLDEPSDDPAANDNSPGILAGHAPTETLPDGHAIRIATGARVPDGATAVLRSEHGEIRDLGEGRARLVAPRAAPPGQDIRPRGQECRRGDQLLPAGALVTPAVLGLAAAAGYDELTVYPRPRVEVLILGDELLRRGLPEEGRIRDALGPMLAPWLRALGAEAAAPRHLADDADSLHAAIAASTADVVITTGGTASGPVDHVHPTLRRLGAEVLVDGVEVRPGHPMLLARLTPHRHLVGLPGNPLAAVSGLLTLAEPLLRTLAARRPAPGWRTPLTGAVHGHPHDTRLVPVAYRDDERAGLTAAPLHYNGPAMLRGIAAADALAVVPAGGADRGAEVELLELPWSAGGSTDWPAHDTPEANAPGGAPEGAAGGPRTAPGGTGGGPDPVRSTFPVPPSGGAA